MAQVKKGTAAKKPRAVKIKAEWCKGCAICVAFCPKEALYLNDNAKVEVDRERCSGCGICEAFCPDFAIEMQQEEGVN